MSPKRRTLAMYGPRGKIPEAEWGTARGAVRVLEDPNLKTGYVLVQWYDHGRRRVETFPMTREGRAEAKAYAQGLAERRFGPPVRERLALRELWQRYIGAQSHLAPRTRQLYAEHWMQWELFLGAEFVAEDARTETLDRFRAALAARSLAISHQQRIVRDIKTVYAWADSRELLARNKLAGYRFRVAKEHRSKKSPGEYRLEDVERILAALSPQETTQWRAWAAITIAACQGARERAILHLAWKDIDFTEPGWITWRARYDKNGREWRQRLTFGAYAALLTARWWQEKDGSRWPWVFYANRPPAQTTKTRREEPGVWTTRALWWALTEAEKRAGVEHLPMRAMHGLRRGAAGNVARATGDAWLAIQYIGDRDPDRIVDYVQERDDALAGAVEHLDAAWTRPVNRPSTKAPPDAQLLLFQAPEAGLEPATRSLEGAPPASTARNKLHDSSTTFPPDQGKSGEKSTKRPSTKRQLGRRRKGDR